MCEIKINIKEVEYYIDNNLNRLMRTEKVVFQESISFPCKNDEKNTIFVYMVPLLNGQYRIEGIESDVRLDIRDEYMEKIMKIIFHMVWKYIILNTAKPKNISSTKQTFTYG